MVVSRETPISKAHKAVAGLFALVVLVAAGCSSAGNVRGTSPSSGSDTSVVDSATAGLDTTTAVVEDEPITSESETAGPPGVTTMTLTDWEQVNLDSAGYAPEIDVPPITPQFVGLELASDSPFLLDGRPPDMRFQRQCLVGSSVLGDYTDKDLAELGGSVEITSTTFFVENGEALADVAAEQLSTELGLPSEVIGTSPKMLQIDGDGFTIYVSGREPVEEYETPEGYDDSIFVYDEFSLRLEQVRDESYCERTRPLPAEYSTAIADGMAERSLTLDPGWAYTIKHPNPPGSSESEFLVLAAENGSDRPSFIDQTEPSPEVDLIFSDDGVSLGRRSFS